jgi:DNA processing protein
LTGREDACQPCLGRAALVAALSGHIETAVADASGRRASEILALGDEELLHAMAPNDADAVRGGARLGELRNRLAAGDVWARCRHHDDYPAALLESGEAPAVLFGLGSVEILARLGAELCVTVVGARRPSAYGRELAGLLGRELASAGAIVVSGMAMGIDSCAHEGALEAGGATVAVLGGGPDLPRPQSEHRLHAELVERGLVLSELPPGTEPRRWTFPARNRIMAALGAMTIVVEARERSGSLITSGMAEDLGREVGAVPGQVGAAVAAGTNSLLRDGAHLVRDAQDVLDTLVGPGKHPVQRDAPPSLPAELAAALEAIEGGATGDEVAAATGLDAAETATALTRLELLGLVTADLAGRYRRAHRAPGC